MEIRFRFGKKEFNDAIDNLDTQDDRGAVIVALKFAKTGAEHKIASYIDFIITSLQTDKKPGDRGKFMSYVENRIVSLRMICNSGLDARVTRIIKNHS